MSIRMVPATHEYECDACGKLHQTDRPYEGECPTDWSIVRHIIPLREDHLEGDWISGLLCPECTIRMRDLLSKFLHNPTGMGSPVDSAVDAPDPADDAETGMQEHREAVEDSAVDAGLSTGKIVRAAVITTDDSVEVTYQDGGKEVTRRMSTQEFRNAQFMGGIGDEVWD